MREYRDTTFRAKQSEAPLICFTVCAPAAVGASVFSLGLGAGVLFAAAVVVLVTAGMLASLAHLARPLRALRSLAHLKSSWLSREILVVALFWAIAVLWLVSELGAMEALPQASSGGAFWRHASVACNACAAMVGIALLWVIARAYRVHGQPAWNGSDTVWELVGGAVGSGGAAAAALASWGVLAGVELFPGMGGAGGLGAALTAYPAAETALLLAFLGVVAVCALVASYALVRFASVRRERRVEALVQIEGSPRAFAAQRELQAQGKPRGYVRLSAVALTLALVALGCAVLTYVFGGAAPMCAAALVACFLVELAAQAAVRQRFYSLAQHLRYVATRGQRTAAAQRALQERALQGTPSRR
ncbi:MAG TPA: dimethyl sulfoxide reductase anchor subunit [Candidatus Aphodovivens excrementavium]|nr:dimethyl sulfoxide reductase anchor subunit [Candidatus Aphodovivens excrementavium]